LALCLVISVAGLAFADSSKDAAGDSSPRAKLPAASPAELMLRTKDAPTTSKVESLRLQSKKSSRF